MNGSTVWSRWLERLVLVFPVVVGAGVVSVLAGAPVPEIQRAVLLGVAVVALAIRVGIPLCLFLDSRALDRNTASWVPRGWLYAAGALLISAPLVALVYLYRRYEHALPAPTDSRWWLVVALALVLPVVALGVGLLGTNLPVGTVLAIAGIIAAGLFPVGIYRDSIYVRASNHRWSPNPALYLGAAFLSLLVAVLQPVLAAWYLGKRYRTRVQAP